MNRIHAGRSPGWLRSPAFLPRSVAFATASPQSHGYVLREGEPRRSLSENSGSGFDESSLDLAEAPCGSRRYVRPRERLHSLWLRGSAGRWQRPYTNILSKQKNHSSNRSRLLRAQADIQLLSWIAVWVGLTCETLPLLSHCAFGPVAGASWKAWADEAHLKQRHF